MKGKHIFNSVLVVVLLLALSGCSSKKGGKQSFVNRFYHNTTGYYNTYWNAQQLVDEAERTLSSSDSEDYTQLLSVFPYDSNLDKGLVSANMDKAIEKTAKVNFYHEKSRWQDDAYVLMGKAQILKNDFENAIQTLSYFEEAYDPNNPDGRLNGNSIDREAEIKKRAQKRAEEREAKAKKAKEERAKRIAQKKANQKKKEEEAKIKKERDRSNSIKDRSSTIKKKKERKRKSKKRRSSKKRKKSKKRRPKKEDIPFKTTEKIERNKVTTKTQPKKVESSVTPIENDTKQSSSEEDDVLELKDETKYTEVYNRGRLLLAEAHARKGDLNQARYILTKLSNQTEEDKYINKRLPALRAFVDLKDKDYDSAKTNLTEAIEIESSNRLKSRYAYILGQLYSGENKFSKAYEHFSNSSKWAKDFEMEFNADIKSKFSAYRSNQQSIAAITKDLTKMAKQDKYEDQQALIYSTLADIYVNEGDLEKGKKYLELGARSKTSNPQMKKESYYNLAMLYYDNKNFIDAKMYLDSTLMVISPDDRKAYEITNLSKNLESIANNMNTIILNDSLLNMSNLTDDEIEDLAKKRVKSQDKLDKAKENKSTGSKDPVMVNQKNVSFPLYKTNLRKKGKQSFDKKWGRRPLVDNWRIKSVIENDLFQTDDEYLDKKDRIEAEIANIKKAIPSTAKSQEKLLSSNEEAYFNLGKDLKLNLDDSEESIVVLNMLLSKYPDTEFKPEIYYYLYLNHNDLNNKTAADRYKKALRNDFGDSVFASYLDKKPSGATDGLNDESLYIKAFDAYDNGNYANAEKLTSKGIKEYPESNLIKKYELLNIMSKAASISKEDYITLLKNFYRKNTNTPEGIKASALLTSLTGGNLYNKKSTSSNKLKKSIKYELKLDTDHYVIITASNIPLNKVTPVRAKLSEFNSKKFKSDKLKISFSSLKNETKDIMIVVKNFKTANDANTYLEALERSKNVFDSDTGNKFEKFSISKFNYRRLKKVNTLEGYRKFYQENYTF